MFRFCVPDKQAETRLVVIRKERCGLVFVVFCAYDALIAKTPDMFFAADEILPTFLLCLFP